MTKEINSENLLFFTEMLQIEAYLRENAFPKLKKYRKKFFLPRERIPANLIIMESIDEIEDLFTNYFAYFVTFFSLNT